MKMEGMDEIKFQKIKVEGEDFYSKIGSVMCPYFKESIIFNTRGLEHLKFKGRNRARLQADQYMRFRLITLAPKIIVQSHTVQGVHETRGFELERTNGQWKQLMREVTYYEFVAVINRARVKIIVKQIDNGPKFFWSLIPFWRMGELGKRLMHSGKPEED